MKLFQKIKKFFKNENRKEKEKENPEHDIILDKIIHRYIQNEYINIPIIPDVFETHVYRMLLKTLFDMLQNTLHDTETKLFGHTVSFSLRPVDIHKITKSGFDRNAFKSKNVKYFEDLVRCFVESNQVHIPLLTQDMEKQMYMNILLLLFGIFDDTLRHTRIYIFGQEITFDIHNGHYGLKSHDILNADGVHSERMKRIRRIYEIRKHIIDAQVDHLLKTYNQFFIPDFIEKKIYEMGLTIVYFFVSEISKDISINCLHHNIHVHVRP